jgi:hypothetical protein
VSTEPGPEPQGDDGAIVRVVLRTVLLAASILLLFPSVLDGPTHGAWSATVLAMGPWKWVTWGAVFVLMTLMRFAGGPKRG